MRRRCVGEGEGDDDALRDAEAPDAVLQQEWENVKGLLEENTEEIERLRESVEERGGEDALRGSASAGLKRRVEDLEGDNEDLRAKLEEQAETIAQREEEKEDLADEIEALRLDIEELQRRREAESLERSQSRVQILEESLRGAGSGEGRFEFVEGISWLRLRLSCSRRRMGLR